MGTQYSKGPVPSIYKMHGLWEHTRLDQQLPDCRCYSKGMDWVSRNGEWHRCCNACGLVADSPSPAWMVMKAHSGEENVRTEVSLSVKRERRARRDAGACQRCGMTICPGARGQACSAYTEIIIRPEKWV